MNGHRLPPRIVGRRVRSLGALSTSDARTAAANMSPSISAVTTVMNELGQGVTPSGDEMNAAIAGASAINDAVSSIVSQDTNGDYSSPTGAIASNLSAVQKLLYAEQQNIAANASKGFIGPPDPTVLANAQTAWSAVQANIAGIVTQANTIDVTSSQSAAASQQAAAQAQAQAAAAQGGGGGGSSTPAPSTSGGNATTTTPAGTTTTVSPTSTAVTPTPTTSTTTTTTSTTPTSTTPSSTSASASVAPATTILGMSPPVALFAGIGLMLIVGLASGALEAPTSVARAARSVGIDLPRKRKS